MHRILLPILCLLFVSQNLLAQIKYDPAQLTPQLVELTSEMANFNMLNSEAIGPSGQKSKQYERYEQLKKLASVDHLRILTSHPNAVVRCYAFQALTPSRDSKIIDILLRHLADNERLVSISGSLKSEYLAGDYFLYVANLAECELGEEPFRLSPFDKENIDSILLYNDRVRIAAKDKLLDRLVPQAKHYDRVQEILRDEGNVHAAIALARYQKEDDKELISELLTDKYPKPNRFGLLAAAEFPTEDFFSHIEKIHGREIKRDKDFDLDLIEALYVALVQYKDKNAVALIDKTLIKSNKNAKKLHSEFLWKALKDSPDSVFDKYSGHVRN